MGRIFGAYAYSDAPRHCCWWDETVTAPEWPVLQDDPSCDVAIIGGGFTGTSCALHLAQSGENVALFEANTPGWGASGRNGGFCCLGGSKLAPHAMERYFGRKATQVYYESEEAAVHLVRDLITRHRIEADTHSNGETILAHSPMARKKLIEEADSGAFIDGPDLAKAGLNGPFYAALTTPVGFALNPRKYLFSIMKKAHTSGALLFQNSPITHIERQKSYWQLRSGQICVRAKNVVIATNGYSSDNLPDWLAARYMPAQSTVLVTRPLSQTELDAQGWTSEQMAYDTRNLLHYFRLMPDRRFLFGARGGLFATSRSEARIRRALRRDFEKMFPAWSEVETTHSWSGMVALSGDLTPFVGPVPEHQGLFAGFCYHGNGVAMGSYAGKLLSDLVQHKQPDVPYSPIFQQSARFPLGRFRRLLMPPAYGMMGLVDRSDWISNAMASLSSRHKQ